MTRAKSKLLPLSKIRPIVSDESKYDSVIESKIKSADYRGFQIILQAQRYWSLMENFRVERERNKRYTYGKQWDDEICIDGKRISEEQYIHKQGNVPLKNNLIRRLVKSVIGVYRSQAKEPTCTARDRDEQKLGETMSTILQCNMQLNRMTEVYARTMEEFLISSLIVHRKSYGWRNGKEDCWTDYVQPNNFIIDCNGRDFRGWDISFVGELHDISFGQLCEQFAKTPEDFEKLRNIYKDAADPNYVASYVREFGKADWHDYGFFLTHDPGRCRVIEVWRKEQKARYRCHDYLNGNIFKINIEDFNEEVAKVNAERLAMARQTGMPDDEVPLIKYEWFMDDYWYFYYLSPFGDILKEGETPYEHGSHPYVIKAYPFIDGEIHSFVADVIDQQRYTNRLIIMYDWIMRASAKGVLLIPDDCLPEGTSMEDIAEIWAEFNGVILYKPSKSGKIPQQVANNSVNIGITDLLNIQLKFFEDISGVTGALQGKPGFSGESAAHYNQQTQNATMTLLDTLDSFSDFVVDAAYKDVKNIQQFYDQKRVFNIAGKGGAQIVYDPEKIRDVEFDLSITESTTTPAYRQMANDMLMQLWNAKAISVEQLLEHGDFPFGDDLLQSIKSQREQVAQGQMPDGLSPQILQQVQQQSNPQATQLLQRAVGMPQAA